MVEGVAADYSASAFKRGADTAVRIARLLDERMLWTWKNKAMKMQCDMILLRLWRNSLIKHGNMTSNTANSPITNRLSLGRQSNGSGIKAWMVIRNFSLSFFFLFSIPPPYHRHHPTEEVDEETEEGEQRAAGYFSKVSSKGFSSDSGHGNKSSGPQQKSSPKFPRGNLTSEDEETRRKLIYDRMSKYWDPKQVGVDSEGRFVRAE
ncbi:hypothetical protein R1sor_009411 [Riccia sorocarpa]|uniref:Uncharacterized protein n=1 Tax=Riccia sorocarpa TaxID=122646 RepID=A0ABD3HYJ0_9MARC